MILKDSFVAKFEETSGVTHIAKFKETSGITHIAKFKETSGITQDIYDDAFNDGKQEGLEQGLENAISLGYIKPSGTLDIDKNGKYDVASYEYANVAIPEYTGVYEIKPKTTAQKLETRNKVLNNDLEVRAISYSETTNLSNGITVSIASE